MGNYIINGPNTSNFKEIYDYFKLEDPRFRTCHNMQVFNTKSLLLLEKDFLKIKGSVLIKVFQGESLDYTRDALKKRFNKVKISKPKASRPNSREIYIIGKELKK